MVLNKFEKMYLLMWTRQNLMRPYSLLDTGIFFVITSYLLLRDSVYSVRVLRNIAALMCQDRSSG